MAVLHLLWWWLVVQVLWLIALPICLRVLRPLPDRGTSVAKAFGILVFVYPLWFFGSLGFLDNSRFSYTLVLVLLGALSVAIWRRSAADLWFLLVVASPAADRPGGALPRRLPGLRLCPHVQSGGGQHREVHGLRLYERSLAERELPSARPVVCRRHDQLLLLRTPHGSNPHAPLGPAAGGDVQPDPRAAVRPRGARCVWRGLQPGAGTPAIPDTERAGARETTERTPQARWARTAHGSGG